MQACMHAHTYNTMQAKHYGLTQKNGLELISKIK